MDRKVVVRTGKEDIIKTVEAFYADSTKNGKKYRKFKNHGSEEMPDIITTTEMRKAPFEMINNRSPGKNQIVIESNAGNVMIQALKTEGTTPSQWSNAVIILIYKLKLDIYQPIENKSVSGYDTKNIIEKSVECNKPLVVIFVD